MAYSKQRTQENQAALDKLALQAQEHEVGY